MFQRINLNEVNEAVVRALSENKKRRVIVYAKPWEIEDVKKFKKVGEYTIGNEDRANAAFMWLHSKYPKLKPTSVDEGYGSPTNTEGYTDSYFVFVDGSEEIEGFNFVYPDGFPDDEEEDDKEEPSFVVQRDRPDLPD